MNWKFPAAAVVALLAGAAAAILISHSFSVRDAPGRFCGKGRLLALACGQGIYEADIDRAMAEIRFRRGVEATEANETIRLRRSLVSELATNAAAIRSASAETLSTVEIDREFNLLRFQFRDQKTFLAVLQSSDLSEAALRKTISDNLRARRWVERQLASKANPTAAECSDFYKTHPQEFSQPPRLRVSHLFLAAPPETPPDVVDLKKERIEDLRKRAQAGEDWASLIATESEDEATKGRGGDLGFFAATRMPADFYQAADKLGPGETSDPVQTALGFHIIRGIERKPAEQLAWHRAGDEIADILADEKRVAALRKLDAGLASGVCFNAGISSSRP